MVVLRTPMPLENLKIGDVYGRRRRTRVNDGIICQDLGQDGDFVSFFWTGDFQSLAAGACIAKFLKGQ